MDSSFLPGIFIVVWLAMFVLIIASIGLWIWMLVDAVQVPDDRFFKTGTKITWILVVALAGGIGALIYYFAGRPTPETRAWIKANPQAARTPAWAYQQGPPPYGQPPYGQPPYGQPPQGMPPARGPYNAPQTQAPQPPPSAGPPPS